MDQELILQARQLLEKANRVAVLTGAGISQESGIPTYRGNDGLWNGFSAEDLASIDGFLRDPLKVWQWHNQRRQELKKIIPNAGHAALARLQQKILARQGAWTLATQNIDGLHQAAGSKDVLELHGTILAMKCLHCPNHRHIGYQDVQPVPRCERCNNMMRPSVVWFGEMLPELTWQQAVEAAISCDVFLSVGTSATVYPAAALIDYAIQGGASTIEINLEPTAYSSIVTLALHGKSGEILPQLLEQS